jgi:hypothetical protein
MSWERRLLLNAETQASDAATRRIALPRKGALSALLLRIRITNGSTAGEEHIVDAIDKVEVVADGSNVLFSLEGVELLRWAWYWLKRFPPQSWNEGVSAVQELNLPIFFGRYLGDPMFYLDLGQYRDVELRIQYSPTIAVTSFATATTQFHIPMWVDDSGAAPGPRLGFLRTTQVRAFNSAASGEDITELSRLYKYMDIMVYCREAAIADGVDITTVEVRVDDKRIIPFTGIWDDIQAENEQMFGIIPIVNLLALRANAATIGMRTGRILEAKVGERFTYAATVDFPMYTIASVAGDVITLAGQLVEGSATYAAVALDTTRRTLDVRARGLGIGNAIVIPFALNGNPDLALDPTNMSRLQLALTQGGADGATKISTRELVPA